MGSGSPVVQAAALHFASAVKADEPCEYQLELAEVLPHVFANAWTINKGRFALPETAGLGVAVKEDELAKHCSPAKTWRAA
jgi:L-alanine-DL-glutamate epimerase-like enolase superfamily enzyme